MLRDYRFKWPLANNTIPGPRSLFGMVRNNGTRAHHGWDLRATTGTPCYATAGGRVVSIRDRTGYGRTLDIHLDHLINGSAVYLRLAHLSKVADGIEVGTRVGQGLLVCYTGNSGSSSTGPHLHFEYMKESDPSPGQPGLSRRYDPASIYGDVTPGQTYCEPCAGE
jgi:murein DD-endopeptidase MepM/ murein hydrolase activator NlpD